MTTNVKIFKSTDVGASALTLYGSIPASTGSAGSLIGVLRACLINGYNSVTATSVTVASNVATFNYTAHGFAIGQCLLVAGATPSGLNGEVYVTSIALNSFTFAAPGITDQTASGTITAKMAPAGWTEPYTAATNITCFKQGGGNQFYINLDETAAQGARVAGFESMIAVGIANGSGSFPTTIQIPGGLYWTKSIATDTTTRAWVIIATDRMLYVHVNVDPTVTASANTNCYVFGDIKSYKAVDNRATLIAGSIGNTTPTFHKLTYGSSSGHYLCRDFTQLGGSILASKHMIDGSSIMTNFSGSMLSYPSAVDNGLWLSPIRINEGTSNSPRGELPGIWGPMCGSPFGTMDTIVGTGTLTGKTFLVLNNNYGAGSIFGQFLVEISNTWSI